MKTKLLHRKGFIAVALDDPTKPDNKKDIVAAMTEFYDSDSWCLVDMRLCKYRVLSPYGGSCRADDFHARIKPENEEEEAYIKSLLTDYRQDERTSDDIPEIEWCTFDGIVCGEFTSINKEYNCEHPNLRLDSLAGFFHKKDALEKLKAIQADWEAFEGNPIDAAIDNPYRQPSISDIQFKLITKRMNLSLETEDDSPSP